MIRMKKRRRRKQVKEAKRKNDACTSNNTRVEADMEFLAKSVCCFETDVELRGSSEVAMLEGLHHPICKIELILRMCTCKCWGMKDDSAKAGFEGGR